MSHLGDTISPPLSGIVRGLLAREKSEWQDFNLWMMENSSVPTMWSRTVGRWTDMGQGWRGRKGSDQGIDDAE